MKAVLAQVTVTLLALLNSVSALDIVLVEDVGSVPPTSDPGGDQLEALLEAAAVVWEDAIENPGTLTITWKWGTVADGLSETSDVSILQPWGATITFDNSASRDWYFDPTPDDHSKYNLIRTVRSSLTPSDQTSRFDANAPPKLEVSFSGAAQPTAPDDAKNGFDALTSALHELGHALGMNSNVVTDAETLDGDYDVPAVFNNGGEFAINTFAGDPDHLGPDGSFAAPLMCGNCEITGTRRLPSSTDILAVAAAMYAGSGAAGTMYWTDIDLPRKTWIATAPADWETAGAWLGGAVPDNDDDVFVESAGAVTLTTPKTIRDLTLSGSSTNLFLDGPLVADSVVVNTAGFHMNGGIMTVNRFDLRVPIGGQSQLTGGGEIAITECFENDNLVSAGGNFSGATVLKLIGGAGATIDYDGTSENGQLEAVVGDLEFTGTQADDFDGDLTVQGGHRVTFFDAFNLGSSGLVRLNGGETPSTADAAVIEGNLISIAGKVEVMDECLFANAGTQFLDGSTIEIVDDGSRLALENDSVVMEGASFTGSGRLALKANTSLFLKGITDVGVALQVSGTIALQRLIAVPANASLGSLDLRSNGTLSLSVGSDTDGAATDLVAVAGHAELTGDLEVTVDATAAVAGQRWTVMTFSSRTGDFSDITVSGVPAGMRLAPLYFNDRIELVLQQELSYDEWRAQYMFVTGADSEPDADPDGDGFSNELEFFSMTRPRDPSSSPTVKGRIVRVAGEDYLGIAIDTQLATVATGSGATAEQSADLTEWHRSGTALHGRQIKAGGVWTLVFRSTTPGPMIGQQFLRITVGDGS